jgi:hypothetical protein
MEYAPSLHGTPASTRIRQKSSLPMIGLLTRSTSVGSQLLAWHILSVSLEPKFCRHLFTSHSG